MSGRRRFDDAVIRRLAAGLIVVGLAVGIWALWPRAGSDPTPTTLPVAVESTTTTTTPATTATTDATTTTTDGSHVVTTVEEAEEILRSLWFGWFEGIYNQDEDRIREVVGNPDQIAAAAAQFGELEMARAPVDHDFAFVDTEILETSDDCTAVWTSMSATGFSEAALEGVHVFRWAGDSWLFVSLWTHREDLWEADCDAEF